jgi:glutamate-1-semialdehyde 2,1-aminomutase
MERLAPLGNVYQAGTLSGNPVACAAGLATLRALRDGGVYTRLERLGAALERGLRPGFERLPRPVCLNRFASMFTLFLGVERVTSFQDARRADTSAYGRFFHAMLDRGFYLPPSQLEAAFLSAAHTEDDVSRFCDATLECLGAVL